MFFEDYLHWNRTSPERYAMPRDQFFKRAKELLPLSMTEIRPAAAAG